MLSLALSVALQVGAAAQPPPPSAEPAAAVAPRDEVRHPYFNPLVGLLEFGVGVVGGYAGVLVGVLANIGRGGLSWPPDGMDVLLLGVLPATVAASAAWVMGLFDVSQRSLLGSLLQALVGAAVGEVAGLGAGYLLGGALVGPGDQSGIMSISVFVAPAFAALGSVVAMELFKPGAVQLRASVAPLRDVRGAAGLAPAVAVTF
jgi:hypothetical protein